MGAGNKKGGKQEKETLNMQQMCGVLPCWFNVGGIKQHRSMCASRTVNRMDEE